jgi:two-component sensor histidine kinase
LAFVKNQMYAQFYLLGFIGVLTTLIFSLLSYFSLVDPSQNIAYIFELSIIFEVSVFSFALSYKHKEVTLALQQNELLFKELSHRVKNNLQSIISILTLQRPHLKEPLLKEYMQETIKRICSISLIHEKLQESDAVAKVALSSYLESLSNEFKSFNAKLEIDVSCDSDLYLGVEKTTPLGLIINELISNSVKHAFDDIQTSKIEISLVKNGQEYTFTYSDNGKGYVNATESLGALLIKTLSETQLKGIYTISSDEQYCKRLF